MKKKIPSENRPLGSFGSFAKTIPVQPVVRIEKFRGYVSTRRSGLQRRYYFRLLAANGEIIAQSEAYTRKASRDKTVALLARARMEVVK